MSMFRRFLLRHQAIAMSLIALALLMKMVVPAGYMIGASTRSFTIELCSGSAAMKVAVPMHDMAHGSAGSHQDKQHHGKEMPPCAFSGLSAPSLGGADLLLLATAIVFVLLAVFRNTAQVALPDDPDHLRPPMRGPPARA